ncbi:MAG: AtpZ/AtpI family protein [Actinomycetia bacterium]|nr:AtpZ/AtpI family protein [Actinomycetes bacterium]
MDTPGGTGHPARRRRPELIPREFLRVIAVWSLIPSYLLAGGLIGYALDRWLKVFPYITAVGLLIALVFAVRDMLRLHRSL